uniref:Endonuclease V n=1 Tax=Chromulina nebulosa TaxID=96789 RepID=A0A7S0SSU9_9STRA|mmetsp:Transcript_2806/g.2469  ORF Transcript_2806/g.2469 Transcript_2806/m.2469 type:complete len:240 (+) Transcript_2806:1-720(+)
MTSKQLEEFNKIQQDIRHKVVLKNEFSYIKYVGGLDISFKKDDSNIACAYLTILNIDSLDVVYECYELTMLTVPYISGYLGLREIGPYISLLRKVRKDKPEFYPDVLMIDGNGILHGARAGVASHIGVIENIPTIGVSKTLLCIDGLNEIEVKERFKKECLKKGDYITLIGNDDEILGVALKTSNDAINPRFVSIGTKIDLSSCIDIVNKMSVYINPEPIRLSDIRSKLHFDENITANS